MVPAKQYTAYAGFLNVPKLMSVEKEAVLGARRGVIVMLAKPIQSIITRARIRIVH